MSSEALAVKTASDFIYPIFEHETESFYKAAFSGADKLVDRLHYKMSRLIIKSPVSGIKSCAYTQNGLPFFWNEQPSDYQVTTFSQYGLWSLSPELTGILTTASTLLAIVENYESFGVALTVAEKMLDQYHGLIADGRDIASATGYRDAFFEILD